MATPVRAIAGGVSSASPVVDAFAPGQLVDGRYKIESVLGTGGMSVVYRAEHLHMRRQIALKVLHPHFAYEDEWLVRFRREAMVLSSQEHPNVVKVFGFGQFEHRAYIAMELSAGINLREFLQQKKRLSPEEALPIFLGILGALEHAHSKGVIHRDLKPTNVIIDPSTGAVKLLDFGIAKLMDKGPADHKNLTPTGDVLGTIMYMSPEQCLASELDGRSDLYSAACMMFELLDGAPPFLAANDFAIIPKHLSSPPRRSTYLDNGMGMVILQALGKTPDERPATAVEFARLLEDPPRFRPATRQFSIPSRGLIFAALGAFLGLCIMLAVHLKFSQQQANQTDTHTYNLIRYYADRGDLPQAQRLFRGLSGYGSKSYNQAFTASAKAIADVYHDRQDDSAARYFYDLAIRAMPQTVDHHYEDALLLLIVDSARHDHTEFCNYQIRLCEYYELVHSSSLLECEVGLASSLTMHKRFTEAVAVYRKLLKRQPLQAGLSAELKVLLAACLVEQDALANEFTLSERKLEAWQLANQAVGDPSLSERYRAMDIALIKCLYKVHPQLPTYKQK